MWRKIKSSFILTKVFSYADFKLKLYTIVYNKKIQKKLGYNLNDFKRCSGRYKVLEYGKTKEYNSNNDKLLFEGIYANGKRNGNGKEYNEERNITFEGEYLDGKRWEGIAKEYDEDTGKLILEYHYSKGKIDGEAKEYDKYNGDLLFSGKYLNRKRNWIGKEYKYIPYDKNENSYYKILIIGESK